jgi:hypothetical protein
VLRAIRLTEPQVQVPFGRSVGFAEPQVQVPFGRSVGFAEPQVQVPFGRSVGFAEPQVPGQPGAPVGLPSNGLVHGAHLKPFWQLPVEIPSDWMNPKCRQLLKQTPV